MSSGYSVTTNVGLLIIIASSVIFGLIFSRAEVGQPKEFVDTIISGLWICGVMGAVGAITLAIGIAKDEKKIIQAG